MYTAHLTFDDKTQAYTFYRESTAYDMGRQMGPTTRDARCPVCNTRSPALLFRSDEDLPNSFWAFVPCNQLCERLLQDKSLYLRVSNGSLVKFLVAAAVASHCAGNTGTDSKWDPTPLIQKALQARAVMDKHYEARKKQLDAAGLFEDRRPKGFGDS